MVAVVAVMNMMVITMRRKKTNYKNDITVFKSGGAETQEDKAQ